jgi:quercetin dioxygenase-like cupin family protein
MRRPPERE